MARLLTRQQDWLTQATNLIPRLACRMLHSREVLKGETHATQHRVFLASYGLIRHHITALSTWTFDLLGSSKLITYPRSIFKPLSKAIIF